MEAGVVGRIRREGRQFKGGDRPVDQPGGPVVRGSGGLVGPRLVGLTPLNGA